MAKKRASSNILEKEHVMSGVYPYLLLFALTLVFYGDLIFSNKVLNAMDLLTYVQYFKQFFKNEIFQNHTFPLWVPTINSGMPSANVLFASFYPLNYLFIFFSTNVGINLSLAFHTFLAGAFLYLYMRGIGLKIFASIFSAITFMFSGYFISRVIYCGHDIKMSTVAWIPLVFYFFDKGIRTGKWHYFVFSGIAMGVEALVSHMQIVFYTGLGLIIYSIFGLYWMKKDGHSIGLSNSLYRCLSVMAVVIFMTSAAQLIQMYEFTNLSSRGGGTSYEFATSWSLPPEEILTYILPTLKGLKLSGYYGRMPMSQATIYLGIFPLIMALVAVLYNRNKYVYLFLAICAFSMFIALGRHNPLYRFVYDYVPPFNLFRVPQMILVLFSFAMAGLAGIGSEYIFERQNKEIGQNLRKILYFLVVTSSVTFIAVVSFYLLRSTAPENFKTFLSKAGQLASEKVIYERYMAIILDGTLFFIFIFFSTGIIFLKLKNKVDVRILKVAFIIVLLVDLWHIDYKFMETIPLNNLTTKKSGVVDFLNKDKDRFRVLPGADIASYPANKWTYFGIESLTGYHPTPLGSYSEYLDKLRVNNNLPDLMNAKYLILSSALPANLLNNERSGFSKYELVYDQEVKVYKNKKALPRAFFVNKFKVIEDKNRLLSAIADNRTSLRDVVFFDEDPAVDMSRKGEAKADVNILSYSSNRMALEVDNSSPGFLVLSELYYPGWKVFVDNEEVEVKRANYLLRSVFIDAGRHKVKMFFDPLSLKIGLVMTFAALFLVLPFTVYRKIKEQP